MTVSIDLSDAAGRVDAQPGWLLAILAVLAWYALAGPLVRLHAWAFPGFHTPRPPENWSRERSMATMWALSPIVIPVISVGTALWALSCGVVPPPWKW